MHDLQNMHSYIPKIKTQTPLLNASKKTKVFFPNLDGLRFLCFLSVFFYHSFSSKNSAVRSNPIYKFIKEVICLNGELGINFFFVLSGFLITFLLIIEKNKFGRIDIYSFYVRRVLRIWPLFYVCLLFGFFAFPFLKSYFGYIASENAHWYLYATFLSNFDIINNNALPDASTLSVLWSVAIEEQFYLVWPLLLAIIPEKFYIHVFVSIIIGSFIFRYNHIGTMAFDLHTFSNISDMTVGGLAAYLIYKFPKVKGYFVQLDRKIIYVIYFILFIIYLFRRDIFQYNDFLITFDRVFVSVLFAFIILEQNFSNNSFFKMSKFKTISKLGTYTYGLYCLHMIGFLVAVTLIDKFGWGGNLTLSLVMEPAIALSLSMLLAYLSFTFFESKFLRLKDRFSRITKA